jgi:hypothetical protein
MSGVYDIWLGYDEAGNSVVTLPDEVAAYDEDGGGLFEPEDIADMLNRIPERCQLILPWTGDCRIIRASNGEWTTERRSNGAEH